MNHFQELAKVVGFYDHPIYRTEEKTPWYYEYYVWSPWGTDGTTFMGSIREEIFDSYYKKINYLKGIFESYSGEKTLELGYIQFANSFETMERCKKFINEIAQIFLPMETYWTGGGILEHRIKYSIPVVHELYLHPKVIEFIQK